MVEAKGASESVEALARGEQVARYRREYGLVFATNPRRFRLVRADGAVAEGFDFAPDEAGFWALVHGARGGAALEAPRARFADFLQRCLLHRAPLAKPSDVAFFGRARQGTNSMRRGGCSPRLAGGGEGHKVDG